MKVRCPKCTMEFVVSEPSDADRVMCPECTIAFHHSGGHHGGARAKVGVRNPPAGWAVV